MTVNSIKFVVRTVKALKKEFQTGTFYHCSVAMQGGRIIAMGFNDYTTSHPYYKFGHYKPTKCNHSTSYKPCLHSEIALLKQLLLSDRHNKLHKLTLLNIRINNNGELAYAAPCPNCMKQLQKYNFKKIYFTTDDQNKLGEISFKKLKELV